jgi:ligand-binding sensor domain-containing protein
LPGLKFKEGLHGISDLALARDGSVWVGTTWTGQGLGLEQLVNGTWHPLITATFDSTKLRANGLRLDRDNALWIATDNAGLYRLYDGHVDRFGSADGLTSNSVENFFEDREGNLWLTYVRGRRLFPKHAGYHFLCA